MMLPILISVSLAPGSYFFCALAGVADMAAAAAHAATAIRLGIRAGIVFSPWLYFVRMSQVTCSCASSCLFRRTKRHCCLPPIMIDACQHLSPTRPTAWNRTNELARDIRGSERPDFAPHDGSARDYSEPQAFISLARTLPMRGSRARAKSWRAARAFISRGLASPARTIRALRWLQ